MAPPSPASGPSEPDPMDRLRQIEAQLTPALRELNEKQAEQPMLELRKMIAECKETQPRHAEIAGAFIDFSECVFIVARSTSEPDLSAVIERLETCRSGILSDADEWQQGVDVQVLQAKSKLCTLELQRLSAEMRSISEAQRAGLGRVAQASAPGSFERLTLEAILTYVDACGLVGQATAAQQRMELDVAGTYLQEASVLFQRSLAGLNSTTEQSEIVTLLKGMTAGLESWAEAQKIYAEVLQKALTGGATAESLVDLERAEKLFLKTGIELQKYAKGLNRLTNQGEQNFQATGEQLSRVARNLRQLCLSALRPKSVAARSAPRFFAFFVIAFVVLLGGMRLSGLITELNTASISELLGMCLTVSAFSSFGLDGVRVVKASLAQKKATEQPA
jgi:hypothetical protein